MLAHRQKVLLARVILICPLGHRCQTSALSNTKFLIANVALQEELSGMGNKWPICIFWPKLVHWFTEWNRSTATVLNRVFSFWTCECISTFLSFIDNVLQVIFRKLFPRGVTCFQFVKIIQNKTLQGVVFVDITVFVFIARSRFTAERSIRELFLTGQNARIR
jgi:hypothetical protein